MEKSAPFILNVAIRRWREQLSRRPSLRLENLDELELHLRDAVTALQARGHSEEEAWLTAQRLLGDAGALEREFAKVNRPVRTMRTATSMMISMVVGALLLQANFFVNTEAWWGEFTKWSACVAGATGVTLATFLVVVLPVFALLRRWKRELSFWQAFGVGSFFGFGVVWALACLPQGRGVSLQSLPLLAVGAIAGGAGVATYARFRLTLGTQRMVLGGWIAMGGACACGLALVEHSRMHDAADWLALLVGPFFIALLSSWFVFPMGLLLGVLLPRCIEGFGRWSSFAVGLAIGALVTTLGVSLSLMSAELTIIGSGISGQQLNLVQSATLATALKQAGAVIPVGALWVGLWAARWKTRFGVKLASD